MVLRAFFLSVFDFHNWACGGMPVAGDQPGYADWVCSANSISAPKGCPLTTDLTWCDSS
jgi:hypothetical protein